MTYMYIQPSSLSTVTVYITDMCPKASVYTAKMFTIRLNLNLDLHLNDVAGREIITYYEFKTTGLVVYLAVQCGGGGFSVVINVT